jgi:hypothetical protein
MDQNIIEARGNPYILESLIDPSDAVILAAIEADGTAIRFVPGERQSEDMKMRAIIKSPDSLRWIFNPSDRVILETLEKCGGMISEVKNKNDLYWETALKNDGNAIRFHADPSESLCLTAIRQTGSAIQYVPKEKQTEFLSLAAVIQDPMALEFIHDQTEKLIRAAFFGNACALHFIEKIFNDLEV